MVSSIVGYLEHFLGSEDLTTDATEIGLPKSGPSSSTYSRKGALAAIPTPAHSRYGASVHIMLKKWKNNMVVKAPTMELLDNPSLFVYYT